MGEPRKFEFTHGCERERHGRLRTEDRVRFAVSDNRNVKSIAGAVFQLQRGTRRLFLRGLIQGLQLRLKFKDVHECHALKSICFGLFYEVIKFSPAASSPSKS